MFSTIANEIKTQLEGLEDSSNQPLFGNVLVGMPDKVPLKEGPTAIIELFQTNDIKQAMRGSNLYFRISGAITILTKGMTTTAVEANYAAMDKVLEYFADNTTINETVNGCIIQSVGFGPIQERKAHTQSEKRSLYFGGVVLLDIGKAFEF